MSTDDPLLEFSPFDADEGHLIGRRPEDVPLEILAEKFRDKNPLKAIRARCLDCCCDQPSEVRKCTAADCPSWPFRMGKNPFRKKPVLSKKERQRRAALLRGAPPISQKKRL